VQKFDWEIIAGKYAVVYEKIINMKQLE